MTSNYYQQYTISGLCGKENTMESPHCIYIVKAGHYRPASETPFKWRFTGGPIVARDYPGFEICFYSYVIFFIYSRTRRPQCSSPRCCYVSAETITSFVTDLYLIYIRTAVNQKGPAGCCYNLFVIKYRT